MSSSINTVHNTDSVDKPMCHICCDSNNMLTNYKSCKCNYPLCNECFSKIDMKCPICKLPTKFKYFFAGKMLDPNIKTYSFTSKDYYYDYGPTDYNIQRNIIVSENGRRDYTALTASSCGSIDNINIESIDNYSDLTKSLIYVEKDKYIISGPGLLVAPNGNCSHGQWNGLGIENFSPITIINRNDYMIKRCDVLSLFINGKCDCFQSFREYEKAKSLNKILIVIIEKSEKMSKIHKEFYLYYIDSLLSFSKIPHKMRDYIISSHPDIENTIPELYSYRYYAETLIDYIKLKINIDKDEKLQTIINDIRDTDLAGSTRRIYNFEDTTSEEEDEY